MSDTAEKPAPKVPWHVIVRIAGKALADPGTVRKVAQGQPVRGAVYFRILDAFKAEGIAVPAPEGP